MNVSHWREALASHVAARSWIVAADLLAATTSSATLLRDLGARRILCVGVNRGSGAIPSERGFEEILIDLPLPSDMMGSIHEGERILCDPPPEVMARVDAFDPGREAAVLGTFLARGAPQLGRPLFGARRPAWNALEDKVIIDRVFEEAGVRVAPWRVVPAERASLEEAARALDRGEGTVWAGDARQGFHGGATLTFLVRTPEDAAAAAQTLSERCDRARVTPFLEGIPCSIHGWVLPDGIAVFRPCEMLVLRRPQHPYFFYAQAATTWDPPAWGRAQMREVGRRAGVWLRENVDFRGVFTVDGVMTADGFLPTELNPRFGAALMVLGRTLPDLPLVLLHHASIEGLPIDWRAEALEALVVGEADRTRQLGFMTLSRRASTESRTFGLIRDPDWRLTEEGETPEADGLIGPNSLGSYVRVVMRPGVAQAGPSAAPVAVAVLAMLDRTMDLGVGPLEPAREPTFSAAGPEPSQGR